jgi:predicted dehydrogenase
VSKKPESSPKNPKRTSTQHTLDVEPKARVTRRRFLGASAATAATIVSPHILGLGGRPPPSETLNIVGIGAGGGVCKNDLRNIASLGQNIVAVADCLTMDAWQTKAKAHFKQYYPKATIYRDYRRMLEKEKNIDGVVVAVPDHSHAVLTMAAIQLGKHVYCEKPLTRTIAESRVIAKAAREAGVTTQMGNAGHSGGWIRRICEYIWQGAIGPVREAHVWSDRPFWPCGIGRPGDTPPVPAHLDWDIWLGPAHDRPYHPSYLPNIWRGWVDFGSGAIGDMACHTLDSVVWSLKLGHPISVEASSTPINDQNRETYPKASMITYRFPARGDMPPVKVTWYDGGLLPPIPVDMKRGTKLPKNGCFYVGDNGVLMNDDNQNEPWNPYLLPDSLQEKYPKPKKILPDSIGHFDEWIGSCKGQDVECGSNFDYGARLTETALLGNVALRAGEKIYWDGPNMKVTNVPAANEFVNYSYRKGWTL